AFALAAVAVLMLRRRAPGGALDVASEGPRLGEPTELARWLPRSDGRLRLAVFTSAGCRLCATLAPAVERLVDADRVVLRTYEQQRDHEVWASIEVPGAPYAVVVAADGTVLAKGTINTERQLRGVVEGAHAAAGLPMISITGPDSRRQFLGKATALAGAVAAAPVVGALIKPGEAQAFHICGHIYTTDGCPHPTGLPRIDSRGLPLRAADGARVDDLGRLIDASDLPIDDGGRPLVDPDGRRLPPAPRTSVCQQAARMFGIKARIDGSWYRCCDGHVRKLTDCCTPSSRRINGDPGLTGYCHGGRKVFCVLYFDTKVKC
ncbi:MAG TPA: twin-arginine translocation signal domain-containing protein, partial [Baekduia sp.]|nr:twin-arginine translocation signal domain-containing protein [Baekduia sp.]